MSESGVQGGLIVHVNCGDGKLTAALRVTDRFIVHGLDADAKNVDSARKHIQSLGLSGPVSVQQWTGQRLPYADNLVKSVVVSGQRSVDRAELLRVLCPGGVRGGDRPAIVADGAGRRRAVVPLSLAVGGENVFFHEQNAVVCLVADSNAAQPVVVNPRQQSNWLRWLPQEGELQKCWNLDVGFARAEPPRWMTNTPVRIRALVRTANALFAAGPPDAFDPADPLGALEGRQGAVLLAFNPADGKKVLENQT